MLKPVAESESQATSGTALMPLESTPAAAAVCQLCSLSTALMPPPAPSYASVSQPTSGLELPVG